MAEREPEGAAERFARAGAVAARFTDPPAACKRMEGFLIRF
jgi:hypothetical protein